VSNDHVTVNDGGARQESGYETTRKQEDKKSLSTSRATILLVLY
jgi:hypothetical protein